MPNPPTHARAAAVAALVAATACWGAGTVITKRVLDEVAPLTLLPMQLTASCALLLIACVVRREHFVWTPTTRRLTGLGLLNPGLAYALGLLGLVSISASMSVLLWALEPVLILLLAVVLLHERVPPRLLSALAVAVAGVLLVVYQPGATGNTLGIALTLAAVACCALYTVAVRHLLLDDASLPVVLAQQLAAMTFASRPGHRGPGRRQVPAGRSTVTAGEPGPQPRRPAVCTTGSRSGSSSPGCAKSMRRSPDRSFRSSRSSA